MSRRQHQFVTVFNRTNKVLPGTWNGRHVDIQPGPAKYPILAAEAFKRQNPIMGTGTGFGDIGTEFLIGIVEYGDDCSPTEQSNSIELMDSQELHGARPVAVVQGPKGLYNMRNVKDGPIPNNTSFERD